MIVSVYGRGNWLASELQRENIPVVLVDVTSKLGAWPPEDVEGPFGFFKAETITNSQSERVFSGDQYESVDHGFSIWLSDGPVEFKSPLTKHRLEKLGQNIDVCDFLSHTRPTTGVPPLIGKWASQNFSNSWVLHFAHQFSSTVYSANYRASLVGKPLRLMNPFFVRKATRAGQLKVNEWLAGRRVEVLQKTEILDLSFLNKTTIAGIEIKGERSGVMHFDQLVWTLSSEESYFVNPKIAKYLFSEGEVEAEWCWVRYRLRFSRCEELQSLPLHSVLVDQIAAPWTHQNMLVLQRTAVDDHFDAWIRIPNVQRFNKEYLRIRGDKILEILKLRLTASMAEIQSYPQEFYYTYNEIGPSVFPVFGEKQKKRRVKYKNLSVDSPEVWSAYSWEHQLECQSAVCGGLVKWWELLQKRKEKERRD